MVRVALAGIALFYAGRVSASPMPDSAIGNEVGVSAPNGIPLSNTVERNDHSSTETGWGWTKTSSSAYTYQTTPPSTDTWSPDNSWSSSTEVWKSKSTPTYVNTWSSSASPPTYTSYGSGSSSWGSGSGYDSCVQQCQAQFGAPSASLPPPSTSTGSSGGGSGGGATHTVWVAPSQGVLRYVPFAVNASVGDTVKFIWGANNHTVTKSSELTPCNKTSDAPFASGVQLKDFVFEQVVNDTNTTFFYCGVPTHCQKGMFGIINPPNALGTPSAVGSMMQPMAANNSQFDSMLKYATNATAGNTVASLWGQSIDLAALPAWSHQFVAEGVLYTQTFLAANPDSVSKDGTLDFGLGGNPAVVPPDISTFATSGYGSGYGSSSSSSSIVPMSSSPASSASPSSGLSGSGKTTSGAVSAVSRSSVFVGFVALAAGFFLL